VSDHPFALVTGASKGIGRAVATSLVKEGFDICIHGRNESELLELRKSLLKINTEVQIPIAIADISMQSGVEKLSTIVLQASDRLDVLVNNAGVYLGGEIISEEEGNLELMMNTNLFSAYHLTRKLIGRFLKQGTGHIFNICSIASLAPYPGGSSYCISKFALLGFSKCLRQELKHTGIKVTSILPGAERS
jgi:short-subunit dehydrogenase